MSTIKANTLLHSDGTTTTQPSIPALDTRMAKAWVNFDGTGTITINDSYNVSSISDIGVGDFRYSLVVAMPSLSYITTCSATYDTLGLSAPNSTSEVALTTKTVGGSAFDCIGVQSMVFGS